MLTAPAINSQRSSADRNPPPARPDQSIPGLAAAQAADVGYDLLLEVLTPFIEQQFGSPAPAWWSLLLRPDPTVEQPWLLADVLLPAAVAHKIGQVVGACTNSIGNPVTAADLAIILASTSLPHLMSRGPVRIEPTEPGYNIFLRNRCSLFVGRLHVPDRHIDDVEADIRAEITAWLTAEDLTGVTYFNENDYEPTKIVGEGPRIPGGIRHLVQGYDEGQWIVQADIDQYVPGGGPATRRREIRNALTSIVHLRNGPQPPRHEWSPKPLLTARIWFKTAREVTKNR